MAQRGRKTAEDFKVVDAGSRFRRPAPPEELTQEQAQEWRNVVGALPEDWISKEHFGVLANYCRHVCRNRFIAKSLSELEAQGLKSNDDLEPFNKLAAAAERETRAMLACARSLRLTHQSRQEPKTAYRKTRGYQPSYYETMGNG